MMPRTQAVAAAVAVVLAFTAASGPGAAAGRPPRLAGASVQVANFAFTPASLTTALGTSVTWTFPESMSHTTTSNQGFWDSGPKSGGARFVRVFGSAGRFAYHCSIHSTMHGTVKVPVMAAGSPTTSWMLRWSTAKAGHGRSFDVQIRRGSGPWRSFRTDTARAKGSFAPADAGTYQVRARSTKGGADSGWSPPLTVTVQSG